MTIGGLSPSMMLSTGGPTSNRAASAGSTTANPTIQGRQSIISAEYDDSTPATRPPPPLFGPDAIERFSATKGPLQPLALLWLKSVQKRPGSKQRPSDVQPHVLRGSRASWGKVRVVAPGSGLWSLPVSRCESVSGDWGMGRGCGQRTKKVCAAQKRSELRSSGLFRGSVGKSGVSVRVRGEYIYT